MQAFMCVYLCDVQLIIKLWFNLHFNQTFHWTDVEHYFISAAYMFAIS